MTAIPAMIDSPIRYELNACMCCVHVRQWEAWLRPADVAITGGISNMCWSRVLHVWCRLSLHAGASHHKGGGATVSLQLCISLSVQAMASNISTGYIYCNHTASDNRVYITGILWSRDGAGHCMKALSCGATCFFVPPTHLHRHQPDGTLLSINGGWLW